MIARPGFLIYLINIIILPSVSYSNSNINNNKFPEQNKAISFVENKGQWDAAVLFKADFAGGACQATAKGFSFGYLAPLAKNKISADDESGLQYPGDAKEENNSVFVWNLEFISAGKNLRLEQNNYLETVHHYYKGADPSKWAINCKLSNELFYRHVWKDIDVKVYPNPDDQIEYDIILHPGADANNIRFNLNGPIKSRLRKDGCIEITTPYGIIVKSAPLAYQLINGKRIEVNVSYILDKNILTYSIGNYNNQFDLVIDPLVWSTFISGVSENSYVYDLAADASGNVFVTGYANSKTFPVVPGSFNTKYFGTGRDAVITKVKSGGGNILFTAFIYGSSNDLGFRIAYEYPYIYMTGQAASNDLPITTNASQNANSGGQDAFYVKISEDGTKLLNCSYLGGKSIETVSAIYASEQILYLGGYTSSNNYPIGSYSPNSTLKGSMDAFLFKYDTKTDKVIFSGLIGGTGSEQINDIRADKSILYLTGSTTSADFPVSTSAYKTLKGGTGYDAFAMKWDMAAPKIIYSTYIGGLGTDQASQMEVENGNAYITGNTNSTDFLASKNAYKKAITGTDAFIVKLSVNGDKLEYSTLIGASGTESSYGIFAQNGVVTITGVTDNGKIFPTTETISDKNLLGGQDLFMAVFNLDGSKVLYSTVIGGTGNDYHPALARYKCNTYVSITTHSPTFPTTAKAYMEKKPNGTVDAWAVFSIEMLKDNQNKYKPVKLPEIINLCQHNNQYMLNTGVLQTYWSTGITDSMIAVTKPGIYHAYIYISCDSFYHDSTIFIGIADKPKLAGDTFICSKNFTMNLNSAFDSCIWSTGEKKRIITVDKPGMYWVENKSFCLPLPRDTIIITQDTQSIVFKLSPDGIFCQGKLVTLKTGINTTRWSTGLTAPEIQVSSKGLYWGETRNKCGKTFRDSIYLDYLKPPYFSLRQDTLICNKTSSVILSTGIDSTIWSTGKRGKTETVSRHGMYWASVTDYCGSRHIDSFFLTLDTVISDFNFVKDTLFCGETFSCRLATSYDQTFWSTGEKGKEITVNKAGLYWATTYNKCLDPFSDSVKINLLPVPAVSLPPDTVVCGIVNMKLDCGDPMAVWSTGSSGPVITTRGFGTFIASSFNACGFSSDTIRIYADTLVKQLFVPNAFTPNGNGLNEYFPADNLQVSEFYLSIFNRWGEKIYEAESPWDGYYKETPCMMGPYVWLITYRNCEGKRRYEKGTVTIIK